MPENRIAMTVKELFNSLSFDEIVNALQNTHRNDDSVSCLYGYKEAFDIISNTEFNGDGGEVTFDVTPREECFLFGNLPLFADNVEGDYWENIAGKTIVKPDSNSFTDAELAGAILWGMTFYGFTPRQIKETLHCEIGNLAYTKYGYQVKELKVKNILPYVSPETRRDLKQQLKDEPDCMSIYLSEWHELSKRRMRMNRSKRKRDYRIRSRMERLKKLDKRQHLINSIIKHTNVPLEMIEYQILNAREIYETWRESHVYGKADRIDYITDLVLKFNPILDDICKDADEIIMVVYSGKESPLTEEEDNRLYTAFEPTFILRDIVPTLIKGTDENLRDEVALQIIAIKSRT